MGNKLHVPKNTAKIEREALDTQELRTQHAKHLVGEAGKRLANPGAEYIGSATVQFYKRPIDGNEHKFELIAQVYVAQVPEGLADQGLKQLRETLMECYGRKKPTRVN